MRALGVGVFGVGDLRIGPPVLAALATYFGERPLEIVLHDPNEELVRVMHGVAKAFFRLRGPLHDVVSTTDVREATALSAVRLASAARAPDIPGATLLPHADWPPPLTDAERAAMPLQLLRWHRLEDWPWEPLLRNEISPVRDLLDARLAVGG